MIIDNKGKQNFGSLMIEKAQLTIKIKLLFILYRISFLMHGMIINSFFHSDDILILGIC